MSEKRFSYIVEDYFKNRDTFPVTLTFKNQQVTDEMLSDLRDQVYMEIHNKDGIKILNSELLYGSYWSGILLELNTDEFNSVDTTEFNKDSLYQTLVRIYKEYDTIGTRITGISTNRDVYSVSALQSLEEEYFNVLAQ